MAFSIDFADRNPLRRHAVAGGMRCSPQSAMAPCSVVTRLVPLHVGLNSGAPNGRQSPWRTGSWGRLQMHSGPSSRCGSGEAVVAVRVREVSVVGTRVLRDVFSDDLVREFDFAPCREGLFMSLSDDALFSAVEVGQVAGTDSFPGGIDFDPDVLHGEAAAAPHQQTVFLRQ